MMVDEGLRLYSKAPRVPADVVEPQQAEIHELLTDWGNWQRERYEPGTCASVEKDYYKGGRESTPASTANIQLSPRVEALDHAMRLLRQRVPEHFEALYLYYVERMLPWDANKRIPSICRLLHIHWRGFDRYMWHCRAMAKNIMRELDC